MGRKAGKERLVKAELHLFFDGLVQTCGNFTRCLFDHAFRTHVSY